jgi:pyridoxine 4-dehydrogenase
MPACRMYLAILLLLHAFAVQGIALLGGPTSLSSSSALSSVRVGQVTAGPLRISALGCGTWSWGNRLLWDYDPSQDEEIYQAYQLVRRAGVSVFDTADSYGTLDLNGRAELLLGEFEKRYQSDLSSAQKPWWDVSGNGSVAQRPQQVATKFAPYPWRVTRGSILEAAKASLNRLEQPKLAIAQAHWSTANYQPFQEGAIWEGLADVYDAGLCEAVGVSNYGPNQLRKVAQRMQERQVPLATAQIQYSLMTYQAALPMKDTCDDVNCRLISYSPLCLGLLTGKYTVDNLPRPGNPRRQLFKELLPGSQDLIRTLQAMAREYKKTPSQVAINWASCKGTVPIPGCRTVAQARENLGAVGWQLKSDAVAELDRQAAAVKKPMIQNSKYIPKEPTRSGLSVTALTLFVCPTYDAVFQTK